MLEKIRRYGFPQSPSRQSPGEFPSAATGPLFLKSGVV